MSDKPRSREMIAFRIGAQEFCIPVTSIREIRSWTPVTRIPHAPGFVLGVVNLRGVVLPIIDLAARIGYQPAEPTPRHAIMVAEVDGMVAGLLVDGVSDILTVPDDLIQQTPDIATETAKAFVLGIISIETRMISLVSLSTILPEGEELAA